MGSLLSFSTQAFAELKGTNTRITTEPNMNYSGSPSKTFNLLLDLKTLCDLEQFLLHMLMCSDHHLFGINSMDELLSSNLQLNVALYQRVFVCLFIFLLDHSWPRLKINFSAFLPAVLNFLWYLKCQIFSLLHLAVVWLLLSNSSFLCVQGSEMFHSRV